MAQHGIYSVQIKDSRVIISEENVRIASRPIVVPLDEEARTRLSDYLHEVIGLEHNLPVFAHVLTPMFFEGLENIGLLIHSKEEV